MKATVDGNLVVSETYSFRVPRYVYWEPHEDITAHEVALALPIFVVSQTGSPVDTMVEALPENVRRHFRMVER